nr:hypothetical protein [Ardenticatenales bacterium]
VNQPRTFRFPPQPDSARTAYVVEMLSENATGAGNSVTRDAAERYSGLLSLDGTSLSGDLAMEWGYDLTPQVLSFHIARGLARYGLTLLLALSLWTLPGLALLSWLRGSDENRWSPQRLLGTAIVLSGALLVILPQFTHLVGIRLGSWSVWFLLLASGVSLLLARRRGQGLGPVHSPDGSTVLYGVLLLLLLGSRLLALHPVSAPLWGDSVHHALITQLLLDRGGIFEHYTPYLPLNSFTYHAGFHLLSSWLGWCVLPGSAPLSGEAAVLLNGQLLSTWAIVAVALLAEGLAQRAGEATPARWAGAITLLIAGLLSPMPAFYVNWGRYTQLAGQLFLPPALLWSLAAWTPNAPRRALLPLILMVAAMALTHYRVMMMYMVAVPLLLLILLWEQRRIGSPVRRAMVGRIVASGVATGLLVLPWYWNLTRGLLVRFLGDVVTAPAKPPQALAEVNVFGSITTHVPLWLLVLAGAAMLWLALRRQVAGPLLGAWVLALFVLSNPYTFLRLPGTGLINNFMIQIGLYIPLGALASLGIADAASWLLPRLRLPARPIAGIAALLLLLLGARGAWAQSQLVNAQAFSILTEQDRPAMEWIVQNTPLDARFHVNGFFAFSDSVVVGADGGWWLWLNTQREATVPPIIYTNEIGFEPEYRADVEARYRRLLAAQGTTEQLAEALRLEGIDYVYIGAKQGRAGSPAPLDPLVLHSSPAFETLYSNDFAWLFRVR